MVAGQRLPGVHLMLTDSVATPQNMLHLQHDIVEDDPDNNVYLWNNNRCFSWYWYKKGILPAD